MMPLVNFLYNGTEVIFSGSTSMGYNNLKNKRKVKILQLGPKFQLLWCPTRNLFRPESPGTTEGFELQISCIESSSNPPVVTAICDPNKFRARDHHKRKVMLRTSSIQNKN